MSGQEDTGIRKGNTGVVFLEGGAALQSGAATHEL